LLFVLTIRLDKFVWLFFKNTFSPQIALDNNPNEFVADAIPRKNSTEQYRVIVSRRVRIEIQKTNDDNK